MFRFDLDGSTVGTNRKWFTIEVYCFSSNINWLDYEGIQADIFDHLLSSVSNFDLEIFQNPTGKFGS